MRNDIDQHLQKALAEVQKHPEHWLLPIHRRALYDFLDPDKTIPFNLQIRPWLDLYTLQYVLPFWEPIINDPESIWEGYYDVPLQLASMLEGILNRTINKESVSDSINHWVEVSGTTGEIRESQFYNAWCVFDVGLKAITYLWGNDFLCKRNYFRYNTEATTQLHDLDYSDAANFACIAYSGGEWSQEIPLREDIWRPIGIWNRDSNIVRSRRLQFWKWWLLDAIPKAYEQTQKLQP